jgi:hypothetical protein
MNGFGPQFLPISNENQLSSTDIRKNETPLKPSKSNLASRKALGVLTTNELNSRIQSTPKSIGVRQAAGNSFIFQDVHEDNKVNKVRNMKSIQNESSINVKTKILIDSVSL